MIEPLADTDFPLLSRPRQRVRLRTLIVGAGEAGRVLARDLLRSPELGLEPLGFLDDNVVAEEVGGLPVIGTTAELAEVAHRHSIAAVIIAIPSLSNAEIRRLAEAAASAAVSVRYLPSFGAAIERDARISDLRRMRVDQLLGRDELHVVRSDSRGLIQGKRVLVTGAGGSIGSELCRQIKGFDPGRLLMLDHDESNLHRMLMELTGKALLDNPELIIADIRDRDRIRQLFRHWRPEVVFHAAAHKHLPLLEMHPCEGVKSNVLGTRWLVDAAREFGTERFILISTDKAADPTSVLGATKRLAEMIVEMNAGPPTKFASVRFGNVLGSRGSFLNVLTDQLQNGEPITVTHSDMTRFFMTVEEAVGLVIEAAGLANAGETFVLDMGKPVKILDLVHNTAALMHVGEEDLDIVFTGLRPGEKLDETLFSETEQHVTTLHPRIWATVRRAPDAELGKYLDRLCEVAQRNRMHEVRTILAERFPEVGRPVTTTTDSMAAYYPDDF
ncbi:MAG: polysaccharide biosynthesis protein [Candidatus Dormibacteraeota bacterium]|nr:polysaccharide biosynthesis protein [Candidatus Dormibacteraeota bacterium]